MTTIALKNQARNVNWLIDQFVENTTGVEQAFAVSSDGLLMAVSSNLERSYADRMAAVVAGGRSLADGAARLTGRASFTQVIMEFPGAYLFISSVSGGSALGALSRSDADLGLVGYEIAMLVERVGGELTPELIAELRNSLSAS